VPFGGRDDVLCNTKVQLEQWPLERYVGVCLFRGCRGYGIPMGWVWGLGTVMNPHGPVGIPWGFLM